jgi:hypothetical protein
MRLITSTGLFVGGLGWWRSYDNSIRFLLKFHGLPVNEKALSLSWGIIHIQTLGGNVGLKQGSVLVAGFILIIPEYVGCGETTRLVLVKSGSQ